MDELPLLHRFSLQVPPSGAERAVSEIGELAPQGFEEHDVTLPAGAAVRYVLYAPAKDAAALHADLGDLAERLRSSFGEGVIMSADTIPDQNWREAWKVHFELQRLPPFIICPSWIEYTPSHGDLVIHLDPGSAFGTGLHETTRLCLRAIAALAEGGAAPGRVLDFGTGTGILGIAACLLFPCRVMAVDDDPLALSACDENTTKNGVRERFTLAKGLPKAGPLAELTLANVSRPVLLEKAAALVEVTAPGGVIVLSGLLLTDEAPVLREYSRLGATLLSRTEEKDWLALRLLRGAG